MMNRLTMILLACLLLAGANAVADTERPSVESIAEDPFAALEQFARCGARFEHASRLAETAGKPASAEEYMGASRGALAAAKFFAITLAVQTSGDDPDAFASASDLRLSQVENLYQLERNSQLAFAEQGQLDEAGFKYCFDLQPLQIRTIEAMRRSGLF